MPTDSASFWDRIAHKYSQQPIADQETYRRKLAATQAILRPHMKVLEFGCGTGSTALEHAPYAASILATDVSGEMISIGREKAKQAGINNVTFAQSGVSDFEGEQESYDVILALNLLHLLPDRARAIAKIKRLLKPGGIFISSTVCLSDRMWFIRPLIPILQWFGKAPYVEFLHAEGVINEIKSEGFSIREHWTHGRANSLFLIADKLS